MLNIVKLEQMMLINEQRFGVSGVILAGGKSKRMGMDKATIKIGSSYLIEYPLQILETLFDQVIVVTNERLEEKLNNILAKYSNILIKKDIYPDHGALGGIYTALFHTRTSHVFVTACDMPYLNKDLIGYLKNMVDKDTEVIIPESSGGLETLHAIYAKRLMKIIKIKILNNNNKIKDFFPDVNVDYVPVEVIKTFDIEEKMFKNVNTPQDLSEYLS